jgi:hypothetical protein
VLSILPCLGNGILLGILSHCRDRW